VVQLIVHDGFVDSAPDTASIIASNRPPVAASGLDQTVIVGRTVHLDGTGSHDPDGQSVSYAWSLVSKPVGSVATLSDSHAAMPTFLADKTGTYVVQLVVNDGYWNSAPDTVQITATAVPTAITLTPTPATMLTRGALSMTVTLNAPAGVGGQGVNLSSGAGVVTVPATVTVPQGSVSVGFTATSGYSPGSAVVSATATGLTGDDSTVTVARRNFTLWAPLVGIDRTVVGEIRLAEAAPAGGAHFVMSVSDVSKVTVSPATVEIPQGQTVGTFNLKGGLSVANASVTEDGLADGYTSMTWPLLITDRLIDLPTSREVALGETFEINVLIAPDPAPAGGTAIAIESSDPSVIEVLTPTVTVPEGEFGVKATLRARSATTGSATITASNPSYAPDTSQINITAGLNILETFSFFDAASTDTVYVMLLSGGQPFAVPVGGYGNDDFG
jgi:hypothetical protein